VERLKQVMMRVDEAWENNETREVDDLIGVGRQGCALSRMNMPPSRISARRSSIVTSNAAFRIRSVLIVLPPDNHASAIACSVGRGKKSRIWNPRRICGQRCRPQEAP
jgi:hypothetical protein